MTNELDMSHAADVNGQGLTSEANDIGESDGARPLPRDSKGEALARRMRGAGFRAPCPGPVGPLQNAQPIIDPNAQVMEMLRSMQVAMANKDSLIVQLQETIKNLNAQIAAMTTSLAALQQQQLQQHQPTPAPAQQPAAAPTGA